MKYRTTSKKISCRSNEEHTVCVVQKIPVSWFKKAILEATISVARMRKTVSASRNKKISEKLVHVLLIRSASGVKARFHYEREKEHSLFVLLIFFALTSVLTARFNQRSIKETKNTLFHARSGNGL